jgi:hypothetical protein
MRLMGGWDKDPDYTPPAPPVWVWLLGAVMAIIMIGCCAGLAGY